MFRKEKEKEKEKEKKERVLEKESSQNPFCILNSEFCILHFTPHPF